MIRNVETCEFLTLQKQGLNILDVRSPAEFQHAHLPGAKNMPLFNNEERAAVGTLYKQKGRSQAINLGLNLVQPKIDYFLETAWGQQKENKILLHCWRGGMRSNTMASLLEGQGLSVFTLKGGYKAFRKHMLAALEEVQPKLIVISGFTGSGKTDILHHLRAAGEQVIDLEGLACHKGSAFGNLQNQPQPSQEHFENQLALNLKNLDLNEITFIEDEARVIGSLHLPKTFWQHMRSCKVFHVVVSQSLRAKKLVREYATSRLSTIEAAIDKIARRLGGVRTVAAKEAIGRADFQGAAEIVLDYYDRTYEYGLSQRPASLIETVHFKEMNIVQICQRILNYKKDVQ